jgi:streptogramin lyase
MIGWRLVAHVVAVVIVATPVVGCRAATPQHELAGELTLYYPPVGMVLPGGIVRGPRNALWFPAFTFTRETMRSFVGEVDSAGEITMHPLSHPTAEIHRIAAANDGTLWFTLTVGGQLARTVDTTPHLVDGRAVVARMDTDGTVTEFNAPDRTGMVNLITTAADNSVWVIEDVESQGEAPHQELLHVDQLGAFATVVMPPSAGTVTSLTEGSDGAIWFGSVIGDAQNRARPVVGKVRDGVVAVFPPVGDVYPGRNLLAGPQGTLWLAVANGLVRVSTDGHSISSTVLSLGCLTETAAAAGALWCVDSSGVSRVDTNGHLSRYEFGRRSDFLSGGSSLTLWMTRGLAVGADGTLWVTDPEVYHDSPPIGHIT